MLNKIQHVHFVGIGGSGMSGIAEVLINLGHSVTGSDLKRSATTSRLAELGARIFEGHAAGNVQDAQVVVCSTAVKDDNPEVAEARRRRIPVIPRAEMLAELMRLKHGIAVAGSHGKTTTTSMVALVLDHGGLDPTVVVGGRLGVLGSGARLGRGDYMVVEADESDRSFLRLSPTIAVVTNIDREHLDTYRDLADVQEAFVGFVNKVPFYGSDVLCLDDPPLQDILARVERRVITYGLSPNAHVSAREVALGPQGASYTAVRGGDVLGRVQLRVPGAHNVLNSLAAVAVGLDLELPFDKVQAGLQAFTGVDRRFQQRGEQGGVLVIDDYGHHPTEIRATLDALRTVAGARRCVVLFQPHRYSRTLHLWDEFCRCFLQADVLLLTDV
ncbi:MAG TPA: UDP-N-acetylmuramate--L-alanine ligase, partial [Vicinamibacteria bacterium]|nr:UDP-N-acetylmuramate--L-alanine ligase [Vicinamibacteria bacterium]